jgi:hypothetical protein
VTLTFSGREVALPGFGFVTVTGIVPVDEVVPDAVSWVLDTKVVVIELPPKETRAPLTKLVPVRASVKEPVPKLAGPRCGEHSPAPRRSKTSRSNQPR